MPATAEHTVVPGPVSGPLQSARSTVAVVNMAAVVVATLYFGRALVQPLLIASLLAFVLGPACARLQRAHLPRMVAVLVVVALAFAAIGGIGLVIGRQIVQLADNLPQYEATVLEKWHALMSGGGWMQRLTEGIALPGTRAPGTASVLGFEGGSGLSLARTVALPLFTPLATAGIVLVFTIFILLSSEDLRDRLVRLVGRRDLHRTILAMNEAARRLSRYFLLQLALNTGFGTVAGVGLWMAGLPNPVLWGILAALMRFVPFIGSFIALTPPLLLAVAVMPGWSMAIFVLAFFLSIDMLMGQVVEPLAYGHSTGLTPIAVIVATAFWAFLWGPIGLLLATPITVCLVAIGRHVEPLAFLDVILGDTAPLEPAETFYQRTLEGNRPALLQYARQTVAKTSLTHYYDAVALQGLALAQNDLARDALAFERLEAIHTHIADLLQHLAPLVNRADKTTALPAEWRAEGAIVCIPGRGQLDDLAATMAVQALDAAGFNARQEPNLVLGTSAKPAGDLARTRLCCLSVLEEGSTASGIRYFVRRMQKRMPDATVVVCLWHAAGTSPLLSALRSDGQKEHLILSIGELIAFTQALAARRPPEVVAVDRAVAAVPDQGPPNLASSTPIASADTGLPSR